MTRKTKKEVVILGSGFAAFTLLKKLNYKRFNVTVISPRNHFLFTPLLPSAAVGSLELRSIIEPIRIIRKKLNFVQAYALEINEEKKDKKEGREKTGAQSIFPEKENPRADKIIGNPTASRHAGAVMRGHRGARSFILLMGMGSTAIRP